MGRPGHVTGYLERIQDGPERQARFELTGNRARLGRGVRNNFILSHLIISRHHAEFQLNGEHWEIKDVSVNGILINYNRIASNIFVLLENNDIISFVPEGQLDYRFVCQGGTLQEDDHPEFGHMSPSMLSFPLPPSPQPSTSAAAINAQPDRNYTRPPDYQRGLGRGKQIRIEDGGFPLSPRSPISQPSSQPSSQASLDTPVLSPLIRYSFVDSPGSSVHGGNNNIPSTPARLQHARDLSQYYADAMLTNVPRESSQVHESDGTREQLEGQLLQMLEDDYYCAICSDVLIDPSELECGHRFCSHCIQIWITERQQSNAVPNCPNCRVPISAHRRLLSLTCIPRIYSFLSHAARENRAQILQQRQVEHENWEARQVARRQEAQRARQGDMAESRRQTRADADARFHANRVSRYVYDHLHQRSMNPEVAQAVHPLVQSPAPARPNANSGEPARQSASEGEPARQSVSAGGPARPNVNAGEPARQSASEGEPARQNVSAGEPAIRRYHNYSVVSSPEMAGFSNISYPSPQPAARLPNVRSMPNAQSNSSIAGQNVHGPSSSSVPRPNSHPRLPVFHTNPRSRFVLTNCIRRRDTTGGRGSESPTERQSGDENNVTSEQIQNSSRSGSTNESNNGPRERLPNQAENSATIPTTGSNTVRHTQMPPPARASGPSQVIIPGLARPPSGFFNITRLSLQPAIRHHNVRNLPNVLLTSAYASHLSNSSAPRPSHHPRLPILHTNPRCRCTIPTTISSNTVRPSIPMQMPPPARASGPSPVIIPGHARPPSVPSVVDQRVPSAALSTASNSSTISDPFARAGGIPVDPRERRSAMQVVLHRLIRVAANYREPVEIRQEEVQGTPRVQEEERNVEENIPALAPPMAEQLERYAVGLRNLARRIRVRPARRRSNNAGEVQMVGRARRRRTQHRRRPRRGERRQEHLNSSEQRLLDQLMNYLRRPPSSSLGSGAVRPDGDGDDDVQMIEDDFQVI